MTELSDFEMWKRFSRAANHVSDPGMRAALPLAYATAKLMFHDFPRSHQFVRESLKEAAELGDSVAAQTLREIDAMALYAMGVRRSWKI